MGAERRVGAIENPVRTTADINALKSFDPNVELKYVMDAIRLTREKLPNDVSLIGFVGAPLTLAAYLIEGSPSRNWLEIKQRVFGD